MLGWVNLCFVFVHSRTPGGDICIGFHLSNIFGTNMSAGHISSPNSGMEYAFGLMRPSFGGETIKASQVVWRPCLETLSCGSSPGTKLDTVQVFHPTAWCRLSCCFDKNHGNICGSKLRFHAADEGCHWTGLKWARFRWRVCWGWDRGRYHLSCVFLKIALSLSAKQQEILSAPWHRSWISEIHSLCLCPWREWGNVNKFPGIQNSHFRVATILRLEASHENILKR